MVDTAVAAFKVKRSSFRLVFENPEMDGAEVVCRGAPLSVYFDIAKLNSANSEESRSALVTFAEKVLKEWNLEDEDGSPIPATAEGLMGLEPDFAFKIVSAWTDAMTGVPAPLGQTSPGGGTSAEPPAATEASSASPGS